MTADRRLNIGEEYLIKLQHGESNMRIKGVVIWSFLSGSRSDHKGNIIPIYSAGLKFTNSPDESGEKLIKLLEEREKGQYQTAGEPESNEFVNLSEQFKEALELFADLGAKTVK